MYNENPATPTLAATVFAANKQTKKIKQQKCLHLVAMLYGKKNWVLL